MKYALSFLPCVPPQAELLLSQSWFDPRLIHNDKPGSGGSDRCENSPKFSLKFRTKLHLEISNISKRYLNGFHHVNELWIPEIYDDGGGVGAASVASANLALQIYGNGSVLYTVR